MTRDRFGPIDVILWSQGLLGQWFNSWISWLNIALKFSTAAFCSRECIIRIHSQRHLSCDYCCMYELADQTWRTNPSVISTETAELTAMRIGEHAISRNLGEVALILHGGEPLRAGKDLISRLGTATRSGGRTGCDRRRQLSDQRRRPQRRLLTTLRLPRHPGRGKPGRHRRGTRPAPPVRQ